MKLNFQVLKYFLAIANEESISAACEVLQVTQPTVSRQISELEKELGVLLFERGARKITLTKEGIFLKRRAEEIISLVSKTQKELSSPKQIQGSIAIGGGELKAVDFLCQKMKEFQKLYPKVVFDFITATSDIIKEQMDKGLLDLGVLLEPVDISRYDYFRVPLEEKWCALVPKNSALAQNTSISPKELLKQKLILPKRNDVKNELSSWIGTDITKLNICATHNLNSNTAIMVAEGLGIALTIQTRLLESFSDLKVIDLEPKLPAKTVVAWKKNILMNDVTQKFIEFLREF